MPKSNNQKMKLLYLAEIFRSFTDEEHTLSLKDISAHLQEYGIESERKSLYSDMEALRVFGMEIEQTGKASNSRYYYSNRQFELPELQLLADAVACSKFISEKKSRELIKKIETLTSNYQARMLDRSVIVTNRVKAINDKIYYSIDRIREAIENNVKISYLYFTYNTNKKKFYKNNKELYTLSPYSLAWENGKYYCIGYCDKHKKVINYRIDCMERVEVTDIPRIKDEHFNVTQYSRQVFDMFGGDKMDAKLVFKNDLVRAVMDKFGNNVRIAKYNEEEFSISVELDKSPTFLAWMFQFGEKARIVAPQELKDYMKEYIDKAVNNLNKTEN